MRPARGGGAVATEGALGGRMKHFREALRSRFSKKQRREAA
jgi:hypothetical protein